MCWTSWPSPSPTSLRISERRTDRFLDTARSHGLNAFLADDPGVDSGHMIAQYTAAGIVSELKRLAVPASVDSIPSSAMQEDHVSMGWHAGLSCARRIDGLARVLAIELLTSARALDMRDGGLATTKSSPVITAVREAIRTKVEGPGTDRFISPEIESVFQLVTDGSCWPPPTRHSQPAGLIRQPPRPKDPSWMPSITRPLSPGTVIAYSGIIPAPWRNGGGVTRQIASGKLGAAGNPESVSGGPFYGSCQGMSC